MSRDFVVMEVSTSDEGKIAAHYSEGVVIIIMCTLWSKAFEYLFCLVSVKKDK